MTYDPLRQLRMLPEPWPTLRLNSDSWWVRLLRRVLARHGYGEPAWADPKLARQVSSQFDAQLAELTRQFQLEHGLIADGLVGRETWQALAQVGLAEKPLQQAAERAVTSADEPHLRALIINYAKLLEALEVREHGVNRGEVVEAFQRHAAGKVGYAWCVALCDFVAEQAFAALGLKPPLNVGVSSSGLVRKARNRGRLRGTPAEAEPGDIIVLKGGPTGYQHVGIVVSVQPDGRLRTIEGNTNVAGSSEGDGVYLRTRDYTRTPWVVVDIASP